MIGKGIILHTLSYSFHFFNSFHVAASRSLSLL